MTVSRDRNLDRLDGTKWHRYGAEFPGGRRLRGDLVRLLSTSLPGRVRCQTNYHARDFVNTVQQHLLSLAAAGESRLVDRGAAPNHALHC